MIWFERSLKSWMDGWMLTTLKNWPDYIYFLKSKNILKQNISPKQNSWPRCIVEPQRAPKNKIVKG